MLMMCVYLRRYCAAYEKYCITFNPSKSMHVVFNPEKKHYFIPSMISNYTVLLPKCDVKIKYVSLNL